MWADVRPCQPLQAGSQRDPCHDSPENAAKSTKNQGRENREQTERRGRTRRRVKGEGVDPIHRSSQLKVNEAPCHDSPDIEYKQKKRETEKRQKISKRH